MVVSAEILRRAVSEIRDEWSEGRAMGQDRSEWRTWRAVADWLDSVADAHEPPDGGPGNRGRTITIVDDAHAEVIARAYLGESS